MILWLEFLVLSLLALAPVAWSLRGGVPVQGRRAAALRLHRAQLGELERDLRAGLIVPEEHGGAKLELQRRLLAADAMPDAPESRSPSGRPSGRPFGRAASVRAALLLLLLPMAALALYLPGGRPDLPAQPVARRMKEADARMREDAALVDALRQGLARLAPDAPQARAGYLLLGQAEASRGAWGAAAAAWRVALSRGFDPAVAVQAAEAQSRADGAVSPSSADLFRRALAEGPADAPWRSLAQQRLAQSEQHH
ncbi:c-type cytochrome biogenesis protein CcmI [Rhizosaccharibacter radicis]|uniref:C-type cytochrome biogenesis protein CcmI n=1 Tax=Rhizosaccharibacter radicis TaxID=2782605 RepID=A0ABT1VXP5_9PROT|nr:c-type cytochrome biogenesis protein CcmI [Acetobacteraceae bacterium KSS12]